LALDWTAWGGIGMATRGSIPKIMAAAGVELLPPEAGIAWLRRELAAETPPEAEVVVAGALGTMAGRPHPTGGVDPEALPATGPMIGAVRAVDVHDGLVVERTFDPTAHPFLNDHRIDGVAVLPGAAARLGRRRGGAARLPRTGEVLPRRAAHAHRQRAPAPGGRRRGRRMPADRGADTAR
jgi:hypothetical protein